MPFHLDEFSDGNHCGILNARLLESLMNSVLNTCVISHAANSMQSHHEPREADYPCTFSPKGGKEWPLAFVRPASVISP